MTPMDPTPPVRGTVMWSQAEAQAAGGRMYVELMVQAGLEANTLATAADVLPALPAESLREGEVRSALDGLAARLAAQRIQQDPASRCRLEEALFAGQDIVSATLSELVRLDVAFHRALYALSGNSEIEVTVGPQWPHMRRSMACVLSRPGYPATVWDEHAAIAERVLAGDAEGAECAARAHALAAGRMTEAQLRADMAA